MIPALQKFVINLLQHTDFFLPLLSLDFRPPLSPEGPALSLGLSACSQDAVIIFLRGPPFRGVPRKISAVPGVASLKEGGWASPGVPWCLLISHSGVLSLWTLRSRPEERSLGWYSRNRTLVSPRPGRAWESFLCQNKESSKKDTGRHSSTTNEEDSALSPARGPGSLRGRKQPVRTPSHTARTCRVKTPPLKPELAGCRRESARHQDSSGKKR